MDPNYQCLNVKREKMDRAINKLENAPLISKGVLGTLYKQRGALSVLQSCTDNDPLSKIKEARQDYFNAMTHISNISNQEKTDEIAKIVKEADVIINSQGSKDTKELMKLVGIKLN